MMYNVVCCNKQYKSSEWHKLRNEGSNMRHKLAASSAAAAAAAAATCLGMRTHQHTHSLYNINFLLYKRSTRETCVRKIARMVLYAEL